MTGSRAELALLLAAALVSGAAAAQTPKSATAPPAAMKPLPASPAQPGPADKAPIEVNALGSPDGPAAGLLERGNGGMAEDIWSGSDRATVNDLLARVPLASGVYSVRTLSRKVVLTVADPPTGQAPHSFQTMRLKALLDAGLVTEAAHLAMQVQLKDDPEFMRAQAVAILLGGMPSDVCSGSTSSRDTNSDPMWMQLRAYCYAVSGQHDLLELTRGVMKAQGSYERGFETLLDDVLNHKIVQPGEIHDPTPVDVFLLRQAEFPISTALSAKFGQAASMVALRDAKNSPAVRADAAAQALHTGWMTSAELNTIADAQAFTPQQIANAENAAPALPFFQGQALIRQALAVTADNDEKAQLVGVALRMGRQMQLSTVAVRMQERGLVSVMPNPKLHAYVAPFARALMLVRQADAAERWREALDPNNEADHALAAALAVELNLIAPNPGRAQRAQTALQWLAANAASNQPVDGPEEQRYDVTAIALYDALGEPLPQSAAAAPLLAEKWTGRVLAPATRKKLEDLRGQPTRKGEAILTILDAVGALGPGDLAPDAVAFLVRDLKAEGEGDAARALAIDALLLHQAAS